MMKRIGLFLLIFSMCLIGIAMADDIMPTADEVFDTTTAALTTRKTVNFSLITYDDMTSITVTACWLEKQEDGEWVWQSSLSAPSAVAANTNVYGAVMDYSADIGSGTYRIGFTMNADGHVISRYSNSRTFK